MSKSELYISTDVETDGPIPGVNSMLSIGSAIFDSDGKQLSSFYANLEPRTGCQQDPETMAWWKTQPEAWKAVTCDQESPVIVMRHYSDWLKIWKDEHSLVFVGYPASFDFMFVYWYLIFYTGHSPFSFSALDIKTYAMATLNVNYKSATKRNMPKEWFEGLPSHTHNALDDAIEQGLLFCNILKYRKNREK